MSKLGAMFWIDLVLLLVCVAALVRGLSGGVEGGRETAMVAVAALAVLVLGIETVRRLRKPKA